MGVIVAVFVDVLVGVRGVCVSVWVAVKVSVILGVDVKDLGELLGVPLLFARKVSTLLTSLTISRENPEQEETNKKLNKKIGYNIFIKTHQ